MTCSRQILAIAAFYCFIGPLYGDGGVDYDQQIAPLLSKNCVACHNTQTAEGGLNLENHALMLTGGDSGDAIVPGDLSASYLYTRISGAEEPLMPPEDNAVGAQALTAEELQLFQEWIAGGALAGKTTAQAKMQWQTLPNDLRPVYALAGSPDGRKMAFGLGSALVVAGSGGHDKPAFLVDPILPDGQSAHLDIVQSVAFSPDSQRIATGGFRTVKIWRQQTDATQLLAGLSRSIRFSSLSSDGSLLAVVTEKGVLEITDLESGLSQRYLKNQDPGIEDIAWLGNSHRLVSCSADSIWTLTDADSGQVLPLSVPQATQAKSLLSMANGGLVCITDKAEVWKLEIHPDGSVESTAIPSLTGVSIVTSLGASDSQLLGVFPQGRAVVFNLATQQVRRELVLGDDIRDVRASPEGKHLAVSRSKGPVEIWQMDSGELLTSLKEDYRVQQQMLVANRQVARQQNWIELLSNQLPGLKTAKDKEAEAKKKVAESRQQAADKFAEEKQSVESANQAVSLAEKAVSEADAALKAAQEKLTEMTAQLETKKKAVTEAESKFKTAETSLSKRDQALATATESATRAAKALPELETLISSEQNRLTELKKSLDVLTSNSLPPAPLEVLFHEDYVAVASQDQVIRLYSIGGTPIANLAADESPSAVHLRQSSEQLLALADTGRLFAWNLDLGWKLEKTIGSDSDSPFSDRITALDFSPDGRLLAIGSGPPSRSGELQILELESARIRDQFGEIHSDTIFAAQFSPDGRQLATGSADKLCKLFNVDNGELIRSFEGHTHHVLDVAWRDDGQQLATASADATVKLWKVATGSQDRTLSNFAREPTSLAYLGQTHQLAVAAADGSVRLVNADDGKTIRSFPGANDALFRVVPIKSDSQVAAGGQAGRVWTWQVADGKLIKVFPVPEAE